MSQRHDPFFDGAQGGKRAGQPGLYLAADGSTPPTADEGAKWEEQAADIGDPLLHALVWLTPPSRPRALGRVTSGRRPTGTARWGRTRRCA